MLLVALLTTFRRISYNRDGPKIITQAVYYKLNYDETMMPPELKQAILEGQMPLSVLDVLITSFNELRSEYIEPIPGLLQRAKTALSEHDGKQLK